MLQAFAEAALFGPVELTEFVTTAETTEIAEFVNIVKTEESTQVETIDWAESEWSIAQTN